MKKEKELFLLHWINKIKFLKKEYLKSQDESIKFILIQNLIIIYYELISNKSIETFFKQKNIVDYTIFNFFYLLRHFFVHYPYFLEIENIIITKEILKRSLNWKNNHSDLINFLEKNHKSYDIRDWISGVTFNINLPQLSNDNNKIILKDIVTIIDSKWFHYTENDKIFFVIQYLDIIFQEYLKK